MAVNATGEVSRFAVDHLDPEPYIRKFGHKHRQSIEQFVGLVARSRPDFDEEWIHRALEAIIPPPKLPMFKLADGSLVRATGVTVHGTGIDGTVVAMVVEGREEPFRAPERVFAHDTLNCFLGVPLPYVAPSFTPSPTLEQLEAELAVQEGLLEEDDDSWDLDSVYDIEANIDEIKAQIAKLKG